ncbi:MAG: flagellar motor switch protein FliN [Planctomycetes bacterium]|nr:flagellar motor switch protein FliN [Planctomycetota bacterium]
MEDTPNNQSDPSQASDGEISQSDIDNLMNGGASPSQEATPSTPDQSGEVSQADIDALMNGGDAASTQAAAPAPASSDEISQSDIDALMGGGDSPAADPGAQVMAASDGVSQADIDALFDGGGSADAGAPTESAATEPAAPEVDTRVDTLGRPFDAAAAEMQAALDAEKAEAAANPSTPAPAPFAPQPLQADAGLTVDPKRVTMLSDVKLRVKIELGRTRMLVEDVLKLGEGSVVELDKLAGDPVDVIVNGRLVARGEVLILNDNFCVRVSEVLSHDPHRITV